MRRVTSNVSAAFDKLRDATSASEQPARRRASTITTNKIFFIITFSLRYKAIGSGLTILIHLLTDKILYWDTPFRAVQRTDDSSLACGQHNMSVDHCGFHIFMPK